MIKKIAIKLFPELQSTTHLPQMAIVVATPDPPNAGQTNSHERPYYAIDIQLLTENGKTDSNMPIMRDVPVAMTASAPDRGFAALPRPGTIVEIAFAYGRQDQPFVRSIMPYYNSLPTIDADTMRWQQTAQSYQEVDAPGNWHLETDQNTSCHVAMNNTDLIDMNEDRIIGLSYDEQIGINYTSLVGMNYSSTVGLNRDITVGVNDTKNVIANHAITVGANDTEIVILAKNQTVKKSWNRQTIEHLTETVGEDYTITTGGAKSETTVGTNTRQAAAITDTAITTHTTVAPLIYAGNGTINLWELVESLMGICTGEFSPSGSAAVSQLKSTLSQMIIKTP